MARVCLSPCKLAAGKAESEVQAVAPPAPQVLMAVLLVYGRKASFWRSQPGLTLAIRRMYLVTSVAPAKFAYCAWLSGYKLIRPVRGLVICSLLSRNGLSQVISFVLFWKNDPIYAA